MTEFPDTKSEILVRIQSHEDREAWEQFVSMYRPIIYRIARRRGLQDADAQDVTQRVLLSVAGAIHRWESGDDRVRFRHWLRRVTKNAVLNALTRRPDDEGQGGTDAQDLLSEQEKQNPDFEREFVLETRREIFHRAATVVQDELRGNTWQAFHLTVVNGMPVVEAAETLGISEGGVYAAQGRAMDRLKRAVKKIEETEA